MFFSCSGSILLFIISHDSHRKRLQIFIQQTNIGSKGELATLLLRNPFIIFFSFHPTLCTIAIVLSVIDFVAHSKLVFFGTYNIIPV